MTIILSVNSMHTQEHMQGNGFMGALTRKVLMPPQESAPFQGGYASIPRRDISWGARDDTSKYTGDSLVVPDGNRNIIPPRFEHRMDKESLEGLTGQNWRSQQDRTVTLHETGARVRPLYKQKLPGLKTADLSHRLRYSPRGNKKPIFINQSPHSEKPERKLPAKERLTLPNQTYDKKSEPRINRRGINISKLKNKTEVHVKSSTQNDPRIKSNCNPKSDIPNAQLVTSIDGYLGSVRDSLSPILTPQYFDEVTSLKEETQTEIQETFDVPLPPTESPKPTNVASQERSGITKDSFWDETDDCLPLEINPANFSRNIQDTLAPVHANCTNPSELTISKKAMDCDHNINSSFFDDEISSNANQPTDSLNPNKLCNKHNNPHKNAIKQRRKDDKLKRYNRKELTNEEKKVHTKRSHLNLNSHSHSHTKISKVTTHHEQPVNSSSPIIKLSSQTHIRLKKTVNLADHESAHSSSDEDTIPALNKLYIPLPTSPLQPLQLEPTNQIPLKLHSSDSISNFSGQIDFASIQSQEISSLCTRDYTDIGLAVVEVKETPFISNNTDKPASTKDINKILEQRPVMLSESSDIGLHIEYVSDDVMAKSPVGFNVEVTNIPNVNELPSLHIQNLQSLSPKCDIDTPDSVFTPGFSRSHLPPSFSMESIDSPVQSLDSSVVESEGLNPTDKYKSAKRKSTRKPRLVKSNIDSLVRTESDHSFNSTREVCIPLTKLNVRQYGTKARASSLENQKETINSVSTCMLCHRAANEGNLGFLYGPYHKQGDSLKSTHANRIASKECDKNEMWIHAPCALCSPGVLLVSFQLDGLLDSYTSSRNTQCEVCGNTGATLHCQTDSCTRVYHYSCVESSHCSLNESFQLLCPIHATQRVLA